MELRANRALVVMFVKLGANDIDLLILHKCSRLHTDKYILTFLCIPIKKNFKDSGSLKLL